jgi:hypothetical protein
MVRRRNEFFSSISILHDGLYLIVFLEVAVSIWATFIKPVVLPVIIWIIGFEVVTFVMSAVVAVIVTSYPRQFRLNRNISWTSSWLISGAMLACIGVNILTIAFRH